MKTGIQITVALLLLPVITVAFVVGLIWQGSTFGFSLGSEGFWS